MLQLTPMGAAYLKGHHGLAKYMMDVPGVNVDFQDDTGDVAHLCVLLCDVP